MSKIHQICPVCAACNIKQKDGYYMCCGCRHKWKDVKSSSVFDHITQSVEALAEKLVYWEHDDWGSWWTSNVLDEEYSTPAEAIAATVEELKKEYKENDTE